MAKSGSIPARAGEPLRSPKASGSKRVYPRACGGTRLGNAPTAGAIGLSPRVRGNHTDPVAAMAEVGSIPARAGEPPAICPAGTP